VLIFLLLAALAGCGGSGSDEQTSGDDLYAYDQSRPLEYRDAGVVNHGYPVKIHDVSYAGPDGERVSAFLVVPPGKGPFPAVVYLHGAEQDRRAMLLPATWLAGRGAVALSVSSPFTRPEGQITAKGIEGVRGERDLTILGVKELRRGVDLLQSRPEVDDDRTGFLGFSAGARTGALLAGVELAYHYRTVRVRSAEQGDATPSAEFSTLLLNHDPESPAGAVSFELVNDASPAGRSTP